MVIYNYYMYKVISKDLQKISKYKNNKNDKIVKEDIRGEISKISMDMDNLRYISIAFFVFSKIMFYIFTII